MMHFKKDKSKGFSLMEIMVVLGLSIFLIFILYNIFIISNQSFNTSDKELELIQNARIFLDRLSREIRQNVEITTLLPITKTDPVFLPPNELQFQDGHGLDNIQYIRYFLDSNLIKRQHIVYYFPAEPNTYVYWDAVDEFGNSPDLEILEERIIAEYFTDVLYYGEDIINIEVFLNKGDSNLHLFSSAWGRNSRE